MCALAKVDVFSFWKKYRPRAPIVDKISGASLLEGFSGLVANFCHPYGYKLIISWLR
jgi:hypothetical protein